MMKNKTTHISAILLITLSIIYVLVWNVNHSPLFSGFFFEYNGQSSTDAIVIGKYWVQGMIPYKDLFGISGPFVYLLEMTGWIGNIRILGFMIQVILYWGIIYGIYQLCKEYLSPFYSCLLSLCFFFFSLGIFSVGETESMLSLFIVIRLYILCFNKRKNFSFISFIKGLLLGLALLTNLPTFLICCIILIGDFFIMQCKKNFHTILYIILGALIVLLPFFIYFKLHHALSEIVMAYGIQAQYFLTGFSTSNEIIRKIIKCSPIIFLLLIAVFTKNCQYTITAFAFLAATFFSNVTWNKCGFIALAIIISTALLCNVSKKYSLLLALVTLLFGCCMFLFPAKSYLSKYLEYCISQNYEDVLSDLNAWNQTAKESTQEIIMVDLPSEYYLLTDLKPSYKFFSKQSELCVFNWEISAGITDYVETCELPWMFMDGSSWVYLHIGHYVLEETWETDAPIAFYSLSSD